MAIGSHASSLGPGDKGETSSDRDASSSSHNNTLPSTPFSDRLAAGRDTFTSDKETALLRHFRYHLSPWLDVGNPESPFGIKIMLLAKAKRPLQSAILALAAHHRALIDRWHRSKDLESSVIFRQDAEQGLEFEEILINRVGRAFLMLEDFLCLTPFQWRKLLLQQKGIYESFASFAADDKVSEPLFWLYFKIGTDSTSFQLR